MKLILKTRRSSAVRLLECWKAGNTDQVGSQLSKLGLEKVKPKIVLQKMLKLRPLETLLKTSTSLLNFRFYSRLSGLNLGHLMVPLTQV